MLPRRLLQRLRPLICPLEPLLAHLPPAARVLDIGCGTGSLLLRAVAEGRVAEGLGTDVRPPHTPSPLHVQRQVDPAP